MVLSRGCQATKDDGSPCGASALRDEPHCFWHSPDHAQEAADARRLGGLRRRKEKTVEGAYDIEGLENVGQIRRLLEIAVLDTLSLENSIARSRVLISATQAAAKLLEVGEFEDRLRALEETVKPRGQKPLWRKR